MTPPAPPRVAARASRWLLPLAVSAAIVAWQLGFNTAAPEPRRETALTASQGTCLDIGYFFYFWWHLGLFPVGAADAPHLGPSRADAEAFVRAHGDRLRMDFGLPTNTPRFGDYGKLFTYVPDVLLRGQPQAPSAVPFDELLWIAALVAVWWAFWREGRARLGALLVLLAGSNPFQLFETFGRGNVFSLPISVTLLMLAAHVRLLGGRRLRGPATWAIALASGVLLACVREVRAEAAFVALSLVAVYALVPRAPLVRRALLALAFVGAFAGTAAAWTRYWQHEWDAATRFVARAGGQVYGGPRGLHHAFWHAAACGLGDFGGDLGFAWDDRASFRWATTYDAATNPHPLPYHYRGGYYFEETWDGVNRIAPTDLPAYGALVRARVLGAIRAHPAWYARVLAQRLLAICGDASPASLTFGAWSLQLPGSGWLLPLALLAVLWRRRRFEAWLLAFPLPLSALALLVYSGRGMTLYGIAHLVALALALDALAAAAWMRHRASRPIV